MIATYRSLKSFQPAQSCKLNFCQQFYVFASVRELCGATAARWSGWAGACSIVPSNSMATVRHTACAPYHCIKYRFGFSRYCVVEARAYAAAQPMRPSGFPAAQHARMHALASALEGIQNIMLVVVYDVLFVFKSALCSVIGAG